MMTYAYTDPDTDFKKRSACCFGSDPHEERAREIAYDRTERHTHYLRVFHEMTDNPEFADYLFDRMSIRTMCKYGVHKDDLYHMMYNLLLLLPQPIQPFNTEEMLNRMVSYRHELACFSYHDCDMRDLVPYVIFHPSCGAPYISYEYQKESINSRDTSQTRCMFVHTPHSFGGEAIEFVATIKPNKDASSIEEWVRGGRQGNVHEALWPQIGEDPVGSINDDTITREYLFELALKRLPEPAYVRYFRDSTGTILEGNSLNSGRGISVPEVRADCDFTHVCLYNEHNKCYAVVNSNGQVQTNGGTYVGFGHYNDSSVEYIHVG